jgi:hypothetical protein
MNEVVEDLGGVRGFVKGKILRWVERMDESLRGGRAKKVGEKK